jgi:hypothetical protein
MAADAPHNSLDTNWWQCYCRRRFRVLLVILLALLAGPQVFLGFGLSQGWFEGLMSLLMLAVIVSLCVESRQRSFAILLGLPAILLPILGQTLPAASGRGTMACGHLCQAIFLFSSAGLIVKSLFNADALSSDSIFGAICGYLFLGLGWAVLYLLIEGFRPNSFAVSPALLSADDPSRLEPSVLSYYSFVTLTTVGYGDVTPVSAITRTLAWIEAMTGQFYLAVVVAGLVSMITTGAGLDRNRASHPQ